MSSRKVAQGKDHRKNGRSGSSGGSGRITPMPSLSLSSFGEFLFGDYHHYHQHSRKGDDHCGNKRCKFDNNGDDDGIKNDDITASLERKANRLSAISFDPRVHTLMSIKRQDRLKVLAYNYLMSTTSAAAAASSTTTTTTMTTHRVAAATATGTAGAAVGTPHRGMPPPPPPPPRAAAQLLLHGGEFHRLEHTLLKFENVERVELLKVAIWKSQCLLQFPSGKYRSYLDMAEWKELGWRTQKRHVFEESAESVDAVARDVLPFLTGEEVDVPTAAAAAAAAAHGHNHHHHHQRHYGSKHHRPSGKRKRCDD